MRVVIGEMSSGHREQSNAARAQLDDGDAFVGRPVLREDGSAFSLILIAAAALVTPGQFSIDAGGVMLTPMRIVLILLFLPACAQYWTRTRGRPARYDLLFFGFAFWTAICILYNRGLGGVERAGQFMLETTVVYLLVQGTVLRYGQLKRMLSVLCLLLFVLVIFGVVEMVVRRHFLIDLFNALTGRPQPVGPLTADRFGLFRVTSIFAHPILFGLFAASMLSLFWYIADRSGDSLRRGALVGAGAVLSLSSAPILVTGVQIIMIGVETFSRGVPHRFRLIGGALAVFLTAIYFGSDRGLFVLIVIFTLDPSTAYYRREIWDQGVDDIQRSPIFGIRPEEWTRHHWMSPSIDNYWLYQAMEGGLPSVILLLAAILVIMRRLFRRPDAALPKELAGARRGVAFALVALCLGGATVHFFDKMQPWFFLCIGLGGAVVRMMEEWERAWRPEIPQTGEDAGGRGERTRLDRRTARSPAGRAAP